MQKCLKRTPQFGSNLVDSHGVCGSNLATALGYLGYSHGVCVVLNSVWLRRFRARAYLGSVLGARVDVTGMGQR